MSIDSSILEKIRKLRALTVERGATEDEAIAAQKAMFTLLAKYNLSISEVESKSAKESRAVGQEKVAAGLFSWEKFLYRSVANLNFCEYLSSGHKRIHIIIGSPANTIATKEMASFLVETICQLAEQAAKGQPAGERWGFLHAFRQGCSSRLCERIDEMRQQAIAGQMKAADPDSLLPALANLYQTNAAANAEYMKGAFSKIRRTKVSTLVRNGAGYHAGSAAANGIGLHKQVGGKSKSSQKALN
jgi:hypothetical protein